MATTYLHRLHLIATAARTPTVNQWVRSNLDSTGSDWLSVPLSPTGTLPATHYGGSVALTTTQARRLARAICAALSMTPPDNGSSFTRAQWKAWLQSVLAELRTRGVSIQWTDNEGAWGSFDAELAALGLKRIETAPP